MPARREGHNQWPVEQNADVLWRLVVDQGLPIVTAAGDLAIAAFRQESTSPATPDRPPEARYMIHALAVPAWEAARIGGQTAFTRLPARPGMSGAVQRPKQERLEGMLVVHGVHGIINGGDPSPLDGQASYSLFSSGAVNLTDELKPPDMSNTEYRQHAANMLAHLAMPDVQLPPWTGVTASLAREVVRWNPFADREMWPFTDEAMQVAVSEALGPMR
jgi:hypothetical protein